MKKVNDYHIGIMRKCCDDYDALLDDVDSLPKVMVRESPKGGLGVFAVDDIEAGSIVTYYPCHYFLTDTPDLMAVVSGMRNDDKTYDQKTIMMTDYSLLFGSETGGVNLFFVGDPTIHDFVGHMMNDSVDLEKLKKSARKVMLGKFDYTHVLRFERDYDNLVKPNAKGELIPGAYHVPIRALRDIKAGEELFTNYGYMYWLTNLTGRKRERKTGNWVKV